MKREKLEQMLNKKVKATILNTELVGILRKSDDEMFKDTPNLYLSDKFYFLEDSSGTPSFLFRSSYVQKCKLINQKG